MKKLCLYLPAVTQDSHSKRQPCTLSSEQKQKQQLDEKNAQARRRYDEKRLQRAEWSAEKRQEQAHEKKRAEVHLSREVRRLKNEWLR